MGNDDEKKKPIVVKETDEMINWMHPQTEERKQRIRDRMMEVIERFKKRRSDD